MSDESMPELMGREECHLCDLARAVMHEAGIDPFRYVDIAGDLDLLSRYAMRIPVLVHGRDELNWPFDAADVKAFLADAND